MSHGRFRSLVENATGLIAILDAQRIVRCKIPAISRLLGNEPSGLVNEPVIQ